MAIAIETLSDDQASTIVRALTRQVAFSTTPPLDGRKIMAPQTVTGPLTFTVPATPAAGAECFVRLVADGTNVPTFAGFAEHGSSAGWFNATGVVNQVRFWFDGTVAYFAIARAANVATFAATAAIVNFADAGSKIIVGYPYNLNTGIVPAPSTFSIVASGGAATVTAIAVTALSTTLTLSRSLTAGETLSTTYTQPASNGLVDLNGNMVTTSSLATENGLLPAGAQYLQFSSLSNVTETARAVGGFDYFQSAGGGYSGGGRGVTTKMLPAGADGWIDFPVLAVGGTGPIVGLQTASTAGGFGSITYGVYADTSNRTSYTVCITGSGNNAPNGSQAAMQAGDILRIRRAGTTVYAEFSRDNRATWTIVHTFARASVASEALYCAFNLGGNMLANALRSLRASTNVA